jgi:endonuclease/exonuclease/phosphatase (EEP) superfamily protein YafD
MLQETHLCRGLGSDSPEQQAFRQAAQLKLRLCHEPAIGTPRANTGGVAILLSHALPHVRLPTVVPGRHICVQVTFADLGDVLLCSYYGHVSDQRQRDDDLVTVLQQLATAGKPFILAGDFNDSPRQVASLASGILPRFGVLEPSSSTCISATL